MTADAAYLLVGIALLLAVILPTLLKRVAFSAPMALILTGVVVGFLPPFETTRLSPLAHPTITEHAAELCVIVALMGVGLALDRPLERTRASWRAWGSTWRLLAIAMPLCIAAVTFLGWWAMGLPIAAALLLGAALAPTDPVLAADVQVGGPTTEQAEDVARHEDEGVHGSVDDGVRGDAEDGAVGDGSADGVHEGVDEHDDVRFALTSEGGLNDALAFPFVYAAIFLADEGPVSEWWLRWLGWEVVGKIALGVLFGYLGGKLLGRVAFRPRMRAFQFARDGEPLLALAGTLFVYGLTELAGGWGFLAVFVAALRLRAEERHDEYHVVMHEMMERLELLLTLLLLLALGVALGDGLLAHLTWQGAAVGLALIFVVRPLTAWLALGRQSDVDEEGNQSLGPRERIVTAFFGVRGIGSIYYLAYALQEADFPYAELLWSTVGFTILVSVVVHGMGATPAMRWLESVRDRPGRQEPSTP